MLSISGYVPLLNEYPKFYKQANQHTPVFALHGYEDTIVRALQHDKQSTKENFTKSPLVCVGVISHELDSGRVMLVDMAEWLSSFLVIITPCAI
jgi:hypothetical protein